MRTRRHLVDKNRLIGKDEELDGQMPHVVEFLSQTRGARTHRASRGVRHARGTDGDVQDVVGVHVLAHGQRLAVPVDVARHEHGALHHERNEPLEDARHVAETPERRASLLDRTDAGLALAIVAGASRLEDALSAHGIQRRGEFEVGEDGKPWRGLDSRVVHERLLQDAILAGGQSLRARTHGNTPFGEGS